MKKIISAILCVSLLASIICIPVSATEDVVTSESIEEFCEGINDMVTEYSDSEFVTPDFIQEEQGIEKVEEDLELNYCSRLIVQSDKTIDTYNAVDVASGFFNFYVLQFENEEDTNYAYGQYSKDENIISVEYDVSYDALSEVTSDTTILDNQFLTYEDYKNGWYLESTGMDLVLEKYKDQNLPEVIVAVVDTGVDLNCKYLQDRIIPTGFNNAGDGDENSEQDYNGHGTMVSSVIANCTTPNIKITNYRCIRSDGSINSYSLACSAIIQAVNNGADVINCSFGCSGDFELFDQTLEYAWSLSCPVFSSSGNWGGNIEFLQGSPLTASEYMITVGASSRLNSPAIFTNYGKYVDVLAPGDEMNLIGLNNKISLVRGTSFSSPFMASVYAMVCATHQTMSFEERIRRVKNCGSGTDEQYVTDFFGSGIVNPLKLFGLDSLSAPQFSIEPGKYVGEITLELSAESGSNIYYTTDYSYPSPTNGFLYTEPITIYDDSVKIRAVAYKDGNKSNYVFGKFCSAVLGTDDMFTVKENGVITEYKGNVKYLKIPEVINGITVTEISSFSGFDKAELYGVILPDTVEYLGWTMDYYDRPLTVDEQMGAFNDNTTLDFIVGKGIKVIGYYGVSFIPNLFEVQFPNCEEIMCSGFYESSMIGAEFPKVKKVGNEAFYNVSKLRELYLPECEYIGSNAFETVSFLRILYAPKANYSPNQEFIDETFTVDNPSATYLMFNKCSDLTKVDLPLMETIGTCFFERTAIKDVELSNVKYVYDLPDTINISASFYGKYYQPVSVVLSLPATLKYCVPATDYKNEFIEYVVYGTAGINSYAEQWAQENNVKFIELSQETAIVEDIESVWDEYSYKPLVFDARGFNRTYQWYGSYDKKVGNDILLKGYEDKSFNPNDSKPYPYYYCVMTSTDKDIDGNVVSEVTVTSSMCENRLYYMFALPDTHINFDNNLIYTKIKACTNYSEIIGFKDTTSYYVIPSYVYRNNYWYGTGSEILLYTGNQRESYTLIVEGDINGDSAVDALDATAVQLASSGLGELTDVYSVAADTNCDGVIDVTDYAQVVNYAVG